MSGRTSPSGSNAGVSLSVLDRLAPPPPRDLLVDRIERHTSPGDVVLDLHGRGGWVARSAVDHGRRAISLESGPLARLLAELVLRPPDVRHLDAAFQALGASARGESSLRLAIGDLFATRCATCGRSLIADEIVWMAEADGTARPVRKHYRCAVCRDQQGGGEARQAPVADLDLARATATPEAGPAIRLALRARFPVPIGAEPLVDDLLGLHTDRQLVGLAWILERIEGDLRAEPIEAALRLSFLQAVLPASRLAAAPGSRPAALRASGGRLRLPAVETWRERNPWTALEDGFREVRSFVQRLAAGPTGPTQARFSDDLRSLADGPATAVVRTATATALDALAAEAADIARRDLRPRIRLAIGQPPRRPTQDRAALAFHGTAWALGPGAAAALPVESLLGPSLRARWGGQADAVRRTLDAIEPLMARDGRAVILVDDPGAEPLVAAALGAAGAGYRLLEARLGDDADPTGIVELAPPGASVPPGPRTRANVPLSPLAGGAGDPAVVPGRGLFAPPERVDARTFSAADAARTVSETAVEVLRARGEPAPFHRLLAEILVGLDRAGQLRRLASSAPSGTAGDPSPPPADESSDLVERLVGLIREELGRPGQGRLAELEPDRWWLADRDDRLAAAAPLADRVEWAVYSLLSTAGPISEAAFLERIASLFGGYEAPDEALVRACLDSYRSPGARPGRLVTSEALVARSAEQTELLAAIVEAGHRLGMEVWLGSREQARRLDGRPLGERLTERERSVHLPVVARGPVEQLQAVAAIWYVRGRMALMFEVEWTSMLGELLLRRHARIPPDQRLVRFLAVPPERTELVRHKLERSPLLRAALEEGNWHVLKWNHLRTFLAAERPDLDQLEPLLGLDPAAERSGEQLPLFAGER